MGRVLSIDLAYRRVRDFGICLLDERNGKVAQVGFVNPEEVLNQNKQPGFKRPPPAKECANVISAFCRQNDIRVLLLDGPQGWKDPQSELPYRRCEKILSTQAKTGIAHQVKPKNFTRFVEFSISLFEQLTKSGAALVETPTVESPSTGYLVAESYPRSAWKKLAVKPLAGKKKATPSERKRCLDTLQKQFGFEVREDPTHDELCALVAGLAGVAIVAGYADGYVAEGVAPKRVGGVIVEGFIVNPCIEGGSP
jgi:hypothetical protein